MIELNLRKAYHKSNQSGWFGFLKPKEGIKIRDYLFEPEVMDLLGHPHPSRLAHIILTNPTFILGFTTESDTKTDHFHPKGKPAGSNRPAIIEDLPAAVDTLGTYTVLQYLEENRSRFRYAKGLMRAFRKSEAWHNHDETNGLMTYSELVEKTELTRQEITGLLFTSKKRERIKWTAPPEYEKEFGDEGMLYAFFDRQDPEGPKESAAKLMTTEAHGFVRAVEYNQGEQVPAKSIPQIVEEVLHLLYFDPEGVYYHTPEAIQSRKLTHRLEMFFYKLVILASLGVISATLMARFLPDHWKKIRESVQGINNAIRDQLDDRGQQDGK